MIPPKGWQDLRADANRRSQMWASSDRGWLWDGSSEISRGYYLDYGPECYRSNHGFCGRECTCALTQPGRILCVVPVSALRRHSRYVETIEEARQWIETTAARVNSKASRV